MSQKGTRIEHRNALLLHLGALLTVVAWGSSFVMTKVILDNGDNSLTPTEAYVYRAIIAYVLMLLLSHRRIMSRDWKDEMLFLVIGMCSGSIYFIAENTALEYTLVSNVSLITTTSPLLTALLVGFVYKNEKPGVAVILGSAVALIGVGMVIFNSSLNLQVNPLGDLLALAAAFSWAVYSIVLRRVNATYDIMFITRKQFFYGLLTGIPFMLLSDEPAHLTVLLDPVVWGNLVGLGLVCSVLSFLVWNQAIKKLGTITTSNYLYIQPIVTLVISAIVLGEVITVIGYTGCGLILAGVYLSDFLSRPRKPSWLSLRKKGSAT